MTMGKSTGLTPDKPISVSSGTMSKVLPLSEPGLPLVKMLVPFYRIVTEN